MYLPDNWPLSDGGSTFTLAAAVEATRGSRQLLDIYRGMQQSQTAVLMTHLGGEQARHRCSEAQDVLSLDDISAAG